MAHPRSRQASEDDGGAPAALTGPALPPDRTPLGCTQVRPPPAARTPGPRPLLAFRTVSKAAPAIWGSDGRAC
eukprot:8962633-Alexandrium_andersonii.AAC.1